MERERCVPFALDERGEVADPYNAPRGGRYTCLGCGQPVKLRRGEVRVPHFSHLGDVRFACSRESVEHQAAKRLVARRLEEGRLGVRVPCEGENCGKTLAKSLSVRPGAKVRLEVQVDPFRADVAVLREDRPVLAVEVLVTHEVSKEKAEALSVPFVEVYASSVLRGQKMLKVRRQTVFPAFECDSCKYAREGREQAERQRLEREEEERLRHEERRRAYEAKRGQATPSGQEPARHDATEMYTFIAAFLREHLPDYRRWVGPSRMVVADCPECGARGVFFDPALITPLGSRFMHRPDPYGFTFCVCPSCKARLTGLPPGFAVLGRDWLMWSGDINKFPPRR